MHHLGHTRKSSAFRQQPDADRPVIKARLWVLGSDLADLRFQLRVRQHQEKDNNARAGAEPFAEPAWAWDPIVVTATGAVVNGHARLAVAREKAHPAGVVRAPARGTGGRRRDHLRARFLEFRV